MKLDPLLSPSQKLTLQLRRENIASKTAYLFKRGKFLKKLWGGDNLVLSTGIRSDEGLTLETSASESLYGGQFTLSTQLIIPNCLSFCCLSIKWRGGLMVSALDSGASAPGSSPGRGHCVVFLGKTLHSHSASLHPGV